RSDRPESTSSSRPSPPSARDPALSETSQRRFGPEQGFRRRFPASPACAVSEISQRSLRGVSETMTTAFVGLGANLGNREKAIRHAAEEIDARRLSTIRETVPWGVTDQPAFLNAVAELHTDLTPRELLDRLMDVERALGRIREGPRWGPRAIDLDLLL